MPGIVKVELTGETQQAVQGLEAASQAVEKISHKGGEAKSALVELKEEAHHLTAAFASVERIAVHFFAVFEAGKKVIELGAAAWELYHAKMEAALSGAEAREHAMDLAHAISRQISELRESGRITAGEALNLSTELGLAREREGRGLHELAAKLIALNPHKKETELLLAELQTRKQAVEVEYNDKEKLGILDLDRINDFTKQRLALADEEHGLEVQLIREKAKNQQEGDLQVALSAEKLKQEKNKIYAEQTAAAQKFVADEAQTRSEAEEEMAKALIDQAEGWDEVRKGQEEQARVEREHAEERRRIGRESQLLLLQKIQLEQKAVETDPTRSEGEKRAALLPVLAREIELVKELVATRKSEETDPNLTEEQKLKSLRERVALEERLLELENQKTATAEPSSVTKGLVGLRNELEQMADFTQNVFQAMGQAMRTAIDGVTESIMAAIEGTQNWGRAFYQAGRQIIASLINITLQYVAGKLAMMAVDAIFHKKSQVEAAQTSAVSGVAGVAKAGEQGGWVGVLIYLAVFAAAVAAIMGIVGAIAGFEQGGVIRGGEQLIRVNERGQEAILNAQALANVGEGFVSALNAGLPIQQAAAVSPTPSIKNNQQVNVLVYDDKARLNEYLQSAEGSSVVVDLMRKNLHNITGRS